jgi:hypothetical protein
MLGLDQYNGRQPAVYDETGFYRKYCDAFELIADQGENNDRNIAFELVSELLNTYAIGNERQRASMAAALSRSSLTGAIDDDAHREWEETAEFLAEDGKDEDTRRHATAQAFVVTEDDDTDESE